MRDLDVRRVLEDHLERAHADGSTVIVHELGIRRGAQRVDLAVVNGSLTGYEIKASSDRLDRLEAQAAAYSQVFDLVHLAVAERHLDRALTLIPAWWGVTVASGSRAGVSLDTHRLAGGNPSVDAEALAELLWRDEALAVLERNGLASGLRSRPRPALVHALVLLDLDDLRAEVRAALRSRGAWRAAVKRV